MAKDKTWVPITWVREGDKNSMFPVQIILMSSNAYKGEKYCVRSGHNCLNTKGEWEYEPQPSSRNDAFYKRCRFDTLEEAKKTLEYCESDISLPLHKKCACGGMMTLQTRVEDNKPLGYLCHNKGCYEEL